MTDGTDPGPEGGFPDPTAPSWASSEPTQPIPATPPPATPPSPYAAPPATPPSPYAAPPAAPPAAPSPQPPYAQPYGQPGYEQPTYEQPTYAQPPYPATEYAQPAYQPAPYGQPPYGQPAYGYPPYATPPRTNSGALALTIVAALATAMCCLLFTPSLVFGIVALTKQSTDPAASARLTRYGWIAAGITLGLGILAVILFFAFGAFASIGGSSSYEFDGT